MLFLDRQEAGDKLARSLMRYKDGDSVVVALPRGGVVVAYPVAKALEAPLDVLVVRKLGAPTQPELGIGALAPGNVRVLNRDLVRLMNITESQIEQVAQREQQEMDRRLRRYRGDMPDLAVEGKTVILVDDGLATGVTARAAIRALRQMNPRQIVLAVPVASPETVAALLDEVDEVVSLGMPPELISVGSWYRNFAQVSDEEVVHLLKLARQENRLHY